MSDEYPEFDAMDVCPCGCYNDYLIQQEEYERDNKKGEEE